MKWVLYSERRVDSTSIV